MALTTAEWVAGSSSTFVRLFTFAFLRWASTRYDIIPGHHFPPLILTSLAVYLATVFTQSDAFGNRPLTLKEAFPKVLGKEEQHEEIHSQDSEHDNHEPVLYEDEKTVIKTLFFGIPNWREAALSYVTIAANILVTLLALDLVFRGPLLHPAKDLRFSRVGYVDEWSAKVLFREPDPAQLPVYVYLKGEDESSWRNTDRIYHLDEDTDHTHSLQFDALVPDMTYTYSLSNDLSGTFRTAPAPYSSGANSLTFLTSSCIKTNFPYRLFSNPLAIHGFEHLSNIIRSLPSPASFMLFLGDFIYIDVPMRLSSSLKHYRAEYRRVYASPSWKLPGISSIPFYHTLDDHEIANDWSSGNDTDPFPAASDPFIHYHVSVNPPAPESAPPDTNTTYFEFTRGPAQFFMLDTRRYRTDPEPVSSTSILPTTNKPLYGSSSSSSNPSQSGHTMLGPNQLSDLLTFLSTPPPPNVHWKIIASSVPFTHNWRFGTSDTWGGFPTERSTILDAMHRAEATQPIRVIILSGDRHEFAAIRFPPPVLDYDANSLPAAPGVAVPLQQRSGGGDGAGVGVTYDKSPQAGPHEFSVGPLSMFYLPFRTFKQVDDSDVAIKYVPDGNSKVGAVDLKNLLGRESGRQGGAAQKSVLRYTLWVDGEVSWEYVLTSPGTGYRGDGETGSGTKVGGGGGRRGLGRLWG